MGNGLTCLAPHHLTVVFRAKSPTVTVLSSGPAVATPAFRRLLMLTLPRLRMRGSPMRSFSDSARCRWLPVSPADVRLKMARRPRREDERVGTTSLVACVVRGEANSWTRRFTHGADEYGSDTELRDAIVASGEEDTPAGVSGGPYFAWWVVPRRRAVSMPRCVVEGDSDNLVSPSLRFENTTESISTRRDPEMMGD